MIVAEPDPTMVIVDPLTVATLVSLLEYVIAPVLTDVGAVIVGAASPMLMLVALSANPVSVGVPLPTVSDAVTGVGAGYKPCEACLAVKVTLPAPTMVIVELLIVATLVLLLVYVIAPKLADVGAVIVGAGPPKLMLDGLTAKPTRVLASASALALAAAAPAAAFSEAPSAPVSGGGSLSLSMRV